jgi:nicotinate-nucleotide adenylyltransferase
MNAQRPKLAIYGGAFNPPTVGHAAAAEILLSSGFERVIVMPCYGHSFGKSLAPAGDRMLMTSECFRHLPQVRVSSFEIDLGMNGSTFELVQKLPQFAEYTTHQIFMAIGSDEANLIHRWRRNEELRQLIAFAIIPRAGHPLNDAGAWARLTPHRVLSAENHAVEISSSLARQTLATGDTAKTSHLVGPQILNHILERRLYPCAA